MALMHSFSLRPRRPISLFTAVSNHIQRQSLYRYLAQRSLLSREVGSISSFHQLERDIRIQCKSHNFGNTAALKLFDIMLSSNPPPSVSSFNILLTHVKRLGDYSLVLWIYKTALGADVLSPDIYTHGIAIDTYFRLGRLDLGFGVLGDLIKRGWNLNVVVLSCLIDGLCKHSRIKDAMKLFETMPELGSTPGAVTYLVLITCYIKMGQIGTGLAILGCMMKFGITPSVQTLNALVHGLCTVDKLVEATALVLRLPHMGFAPDVITYGTLINGYFKSKNACTVEVGFGVFGEMLKRGHHPNTIVCTAMVKGLCDINRVDEASVLVEKMYSKFGCSPNVVTYSTLIKGLCAINRVDEAVVLVEMMRDELGCSPNVITYTTLINGLCCVGDTQAALKLLREMENNEKNDCCKPDKVTYLTIIYNLCRLGEMNEALKELEKMDALKVSDGSRFRKWQRR
ncbi:hypothetical protein ZOSMA_83G00600 [Zostera marina]|uniref:Pentatricopeptide repeat-containing protein n=1 Tax=Zostera marina TaxID=29655 RepID=A0A0K9NLR4_ZOSMR|nr:hypothetical protein ZOSMA_83G00600 [Zostera marina]